MEQHLRDLTATGHLGAFVGMLTDSRSLLSYPRHHYFRRILCNYLGTMIESGEMTAPKKVTVPKATNFLLREFMWIAGLIDFSRVDIKIVFIDADEYRLLDGYGADKKIKATKIDKIPKELLDIVTIDSREAVGNLFMPPELPYEFRAKEFEKATGLRKKGVSAGLRTLESFGIIEREKQSGHKVVYRVII
jgi:hypothetical protein